MYACLWEVQGSCRLSDEAGRRGGWEKGWRERNEDDAHTAGDHETVPLNAYACTTATRMPQTTLPARSPASDCCVPATRRPAPHTHTHTGLARSALGSARLVNARGGIARWFRVRIRWYVCAPPPPSSPSYTFPATFSRPETHGNLLGTLGFYDLLRASLHTSVYQPLSGPPLLLLFPSSFAAVFSSAHGVLNYAHLS